MPTMARHDEEVANLWRSILDSEGVTDPALRATAFRGEDVPLPWTAYIAKVRDQSYRVTDQDVVNLAAGGCSEDAIFEMTLAAALGAAYVGLESGLRALAESE